MSFQYIASESSAHDFERSRGTEKLNHPAYKELNPLWGSRTLSGRAFGWGGGWGAGRVGCGKGAFGMS